MRCFSDDYEEEVEVEEFKIQDDSSTKHCSLDPPALPKVPPRKSDSVSLMLLYTTYYRCCNVIYSCKVSKS